MCLPIAVQRPDSVLENGSVLGFEYTITNNGHGYRCGYIRVPPGHPWHGKHYDEVDAHVHGGLTFAEADTPCEKDGPDNAWWVGFDCGHAFDAADYEMKWDDDKSREIMLGLREQFVSRHELLALPKGWEETVKNTDFVRAHCELLAVQALAVASQSIGLPRNATKRTRTCPV